MHRHFVVVGAQRSGTTYLYRLLDQHPDICMARPMRPEPKFFLAAHGADAGRQAYLDAFFAHRRDERVLGEKSTSYIERDYAIESIARVLPEAQIVFLLRDPVLRAQSNWRFSRAHGIEPLAFDAALAQEAARAVDWDRDAYSVDPFAYAARGHYVRHLDAWRARFPREQMTLMTSERLFADPTHVAPLLERLGLDTAHALPALERINATPADEDAIEPAVLDALRARFRDDTVRLADEWGVDVGAWLQ